MGASSSNYSEWNIDEKWSSQERKSGEMLEASTVRPVGGQPTGLFTQLEEIDIDFRVPELSHAVLKEAENFRVQELVKKIESHPHREALHADLQQNNVYNPFSDESQAMIRDHSATIRRR